MRFYFYLLKSDAKLRRIRSTANTFHTNSYHSNNSQIRIRHMAKKKKTTAEKIDVKDIKPGMQVSVYQTIKELNAKGEEKERTQFFTGMVIKRKGGTSQSATFMVRKISDGVAVEKIFPLHAPSISKVELHKQYKTRRAKLYFLREKNVKMKESKVIKKDVKKKAEAKK